MIPFWNNLKISLKLSISFTFIFVAALVITDLFIYRGIPYTPFMGQIEEYEHEFFKDLDLIANVKKNQIIHWIDDWRKDISVFSQIRSIVNRTSLLNGELANPAFGGSKKEIQNTFDKGYNHNILLDEITTLLNISDWYSSITIVDYESGNIIISTDKTNSVEFFSNGESFRNIVKTKSVSITECGYISDDEGSHLHVSKILEDDNQGTVGIMILKIEYNTIGARLNDSFTGGTQRIETKLINTNSVILLPLEHPLANGLEAEQFTYKLDTMPAFLSSRGEDGFIESIDYRGVPVLSAYRSIMINTDWGLGLILSRDSAELNDLVNRQVQVAIFISGFIILLLIMIVILLSRGITRPIRNLMKVSEQIMLGDYTLKAKVQSSDEIGKLTQSFNKMIINLSESRDNLEIKVVERTKSLELEIFERNKLYFAIEQSPSVVIITDIYFNIEYVNPMFTQISGYSLEEVIGKNPDFLNFGDFSLEIREDMMGEISNFQSQRAVFHNKKKDGDEYWVSASISGIKNADGLLTNILEVQQDITQERKLQEQLVQAQKLEAIGTLAGGVAHDFNNILSVVLGYSEYLLSKLDKEDKIYPMMEDIREASKKGASLTGQLLAFSRKQTIQMTALNLNDLLGKIKKMLFRLISEDVNISLVLEEDLWQIEADHGQMDQILMNIVINSSHAMPEGGSLIIRTGNIDIKQSDSGYNIKSGEGKFVSLSIKDTGCGMDKITLSRIFDPFYTTKPMGKGTGLGLSVVYGIVEQHNGWIDVKSIPGKGTEFIIYLPALEKLETIYSKNDLQSIKQTIKGEKILLVEDDKSLLSFSERILTENGYTVFSASSVNEVFDLFDIESGIFDLIFSDVMLPDINGVKLVEFLLERNPRIKVLLTSGYTNEKSQWDYIVTKGYNFLQKPYTMDTLLIKISEIMQDD